MVSPIFSAWLRAQSRLDFERYSTFTEYQNCKIMVDTNLRNIVMAKGSPELGGRSDMMKPMSE